MLKTSRIGALFLFLFLFVFFAPLFILPFFNHPSADDYICGIHLRREGFVYYQSYIYHNWGGRFAATFTGSLFAAHSFLYEHYYVHTVLLLVTNVAALYFLTSQVFLYIFKEKCLRAYILFYSLVLAALEYSVAAEPSTCLFWFSSAITYQFPVILLTILLGLWLLFYHTQKTMARGIISPMIVLLTIIINGFNELFIIANAFLIIALLFSGVFKNHRSFCLWLVVPTFLASAAFVLLAPGNSSRSALLVSKPLSTGFAVTIFQVGEVIWHLSKNFLFWVCMAGVYVLSNQRRERFVSFPLFKPFVAKLYPFLLYILLFLFASVGLAVMGLKGGMVPDRYLNAIIIITLFLSLVLSFIAGISARRFDWQISRSHLQVLFFTAVSLGLFANDFFKEEYQNLISAPVYNQVMNSRETILKQSAGKELVYVDSYDTALQKIMNVRNKSGSATVSGWLSQKPSFLFYTDDLANEYNRNMIAEFYKVKRILIR